MNLNKYLQANFPSLEIKVPLFYNWDYGLRFEIGLDNISIYKNKNKRILNNEYFEKALYRGTKLFEATFESNDRICIVFQRYSDGRQKIKKNSYVFKYINKFEKIESFKVKNLYRDVYEITDKKKEHHHRLAIYSKLNDMDYTKIINRSIYTDFGGGNIESFFINIDKQVIYHVYDDRGLDIIAKDANILKELYTKFNDWILDYDRKEIDSIFNNIT